MPETKENVASAAPSQPIEVTLPLDRMITSLEGFYQVLTGAPAPSAEGAARRPIPVERDPTEFVGEQVERLLRALDLPVSAGVGSYGPPLSVWEGESQLVIALDVPGTARDELEVAIEGQSLVVRGRRSPKRDALKLAASERPLGPFERRVVLPQRVDLENVEASLADGVLELKIAKRAHSSERREVRVA